MKGSGRNGRTFASGMITAMALGLFAWWFVSGLAICPSNGDLAAECRREADRIGLGAAAIVGGLIALITAFVILGRRANH